VIAFTQWPEFYPAEAYERAVREYAERASREISVRAIYQIGSVGVPGISDIDVLVFVDDAPSLMDPAALSVRSLDGASRYLFMHDTFVIPMGLRDEIAAHYRIQDLSLVSGSAVLNRSHALAPPSQALSLAIISDFLIWIIRDFMTALVSNQIAVRPSLCLLRSLSHSLRLYEENGLHSLPGRRRFDEGVVELRSEAFEIAQSELGDRTRQLIEDGARLGLCMLGHLSERLTTLGLIGLGKNAPTGFRLSSGIYAVFDRQFDGDEAFEKSMNLSFELRGSRSPLRVLNRIVITLPAVFSEQLSAYAKGPGAISSGISDALLPSPTFRSVETEYQKVLAERARLANCQAAFLKQACLRHGQLFLNGYPSAPQRLKFRRLIDLIRMKIASSSSERIPGRA
jgi:hypothetical protein